MLSNLKSLLEFQFHTGSIKRYKEIGADADEVSFNSILVRLKVISACEEIIAEVEVSIPYWFD